MKLNKPKSKLVYVITMHRCGSDELAVCGVTNTLEKAKRIADLFSGHGVLTDIDEVDMHWYDSMLNGECKLFYCSMDDQGSVHIYESSLDENFGKPYESVILDSYHHYKMYTFAKDFGEAESNFREKVAEYIKEHNDDD